MTKSQESGENDVTLEAKKESVRSGRSISEILTAMLAEARRLKNKNRCAKIIKGAEIPWASKSAKAKEEEEVMKWYAAHIVMMVQLRGKKQTRYPVWENILLIRARSEEEAFAKAEEHGRASVGDDDGSFRWEGQAATWVFAGVRKVTGCVDPETRPHDGTEITFNEYVLSSPEAVEQYAAGGEAKLLCRDRFPEEEMETSSPKKPRLEHPVRKLS